MSVLCHITLLQDFQPNLFCKGSERESFTSTPQISTTKIRIRIIFRIVLMETTPHAMEGTAIMQVCEEKENKRKKTKQNWKLR